MNEQQKEIIRKLAYNEPVLFALGALFKEVLGSENILDEVDEEKTNEHIGEKMKAIKIADEMVKECFREIERYKTDADIPEEEGNPGK